MSAGPAPAMPPPPGGGPPAAPTSPVAASPAPPQPSPKLEQGSKIVIMVVQGLRGIAQDFPQTAPIVSQINDLMRQLQLAMMKNVQPQEPAAPPNAG